MNRAIFKRLKSKTYWLGFTTAGLGFLEAAQATGMVPQLFNGKARAAVTLVIALLIFVLRELTKCRVRDK